MQSTGPTEGPRSPGAPAANAGADQIIPVTATATLFGQVTAPLGNAVTRWRVYSGPGNATIANPNVAVTTATFPVPGLYTLMLSEDDGVHAVAFDAVVIRVTLPLTAQASGNDIIVQFPSVVGQRYRVEHSDDLVTGPWTVLADNLAGTGAAFQVPQPNAISLGQQFYRVVILP